MKFRARTVKPVVLIEPTARTPVLLMLGGLTLAMTTTEARTLCDQIHDAIEEIE